MGGLLGDEGAYMCIGVMVEWVYVLYGVGFVTVLVFTSY